jgi:hypothetical protein
VADAQHTTARGARPPPGLSPVGTFVALALVVVSSALLARAQPRADPLRNPDVAAGAAPPARKAEGPRKAPGAAAAGAVFTRLRARLDRAITRRDQGMLATVLARSAPIARRTRRIIAGLRRDGVVDRTRIEPVRTAVVARGVGEIRVRETTLLHPCFVTERGRDVTEAPAAVRQVGVWTLQRQAGGWRITDGRLVADRIVDNGRARC